MSLRVPTDLWLMVFSYSRSSDLGRALSTSKTWNQILESPRAAHLWRACLERDLVSQTRRYSSSGYLHFDQNGREAYKVWNEWIRKRDRDRSIHAMLQVHISQDGCWAYATNALLVILYVALVCWTFGVLSTIATGSVLLIVGSLSIAFGTVACWTRYHVWQLSSKEFPHYGSPSSWLQRSATWYIPWTILPSMALGLLGLQLAGLVPMNAAWIVATSLFALVSCASSYVFFVALYSDFGYSDQTRIINTAKVPAVLCCSCILLTARILLFLQSSDVAIPMWATLLPIMLVLIYVTCCGLYLVYLEVVDCHCSPWISSVGPGVLFGLFPSLLFGAWLIYRFDFHVSGASLFHANWFGCVLILPAVLCYIRFIHRALVRADRYDEDEDCFMIL
jgi:hypothetical protein